MSDERGDKVDQNIAAEPRLAGPGRDRANVDDVVSTRTRIGLASAFAVIAGLAFYLFTKREEVAAAFLRVGVLGVTGYFAFPTLQRVRWRPRNQFETTVLYTAVVLMAIRPKIFLPIGLALLLLIVFKFPTGKGAESKGPPQQSMGGDDERL